MASSDSTPIHAPEYVLIWDIDGTILSTDGAGVRAFDAAIGKLGIEGGKLSAIGDWKGRTDRWLADAVLRHFNLDPETHAEALIQAYLESLPEAFQSGYSALIPGVEKMIERAAVSPAFAQGLLTGNLRKGAQIKLGQFQLWDYFTFGAFADDGFDRMDLPPVTQQYIADSFGHGFPADQVVLIGDTEHDIACAKALGARSLGIASYPGAQDRLASAGADLIVEDFKDLDSIMEWITKN